jgi:hypothetical protein
MSGGGGVITGMLAIASFDALVSTPAAAGRVGKVGLVVATAFQRFVSPDVPAIGVHGQSSHPYATAAGDSSPFAGGTASGVIATTTLTTKAQVPADPQTTLST